MRAIALLHQHQRRVRTAEKNGRKLEYIEVTDQDIALANELCNEVMGRSLDELQPQTRKLLGMLRAMVKERCAELGLERCEYRFGYRDICGFTRWSYEQARKHLQRLIELEYVLVHHGGRGQLFVFELLYDGEGEDGGRFVVGLIDAATTKVSNGSGELSNGGEGDFQPPSNGHPTAIHPPSNGSRIMAEPSSNAVEQPVKASEGENTVLSGASEGAASYVNQRRKLRRTAP